LGARVEYLIKQYPLESGALEIQYIEEYFGEFPRRKTAQEILNRLAGRESIILMAEAPLPDDPGSLVPVSYKIVHEIRNGESEPKLRDLVERLRGYVSFDGRRVLYSWIGGTRRDWRGQGHFRALSEESESWAISQGFDEIVVKTKNRYYDMRAVLAQLQFNVVKFERHETDSAESKVYLAKPLPAELVRDHRSVRTVVHAE
jgi:GNAT superfamily N-acetyltransferase